MPCAHSPKIFANGLGEKLTLEILGKRRLLRERDTLSALCLFLPNGHLGHLLQMLIFPSAHLKKFGANGHKTLGVLLPEISECPFVPVSICEHLGPMGIGHLGYFFPPNVHLPQVPICLTAHLQTFERKWAQKYLDIWGTPFPRMSICPKCPFAPLPICKHLRGNGHRNIWALRVPLSQMSIFISAHFPGAQLS